MRTTVFAAATALTFALSVQVLAQNAAEPAFEVASIKVNTSGSGASSTNGRNGVYSAVNVTLRQLIVNAYRIRDFQLDGGPGWIASDRFDISAKAPDGSTAPNSAMLVTLLADRFKLKVHNETREQPVFALVLARGDKRLGPQLKPSTLDCSNAATRTPGCGTNSSVSNAGGKMTAGGRTMAEVATTLASFGLAQMVIDRTGLTGTYDFELQWLPENQRAAGAQSDLPSIFTALQEQLGLKLEASRGPVDFVVIDSAARPEPD